MALTKLNNQSLSAVTSAGLPSGTVLQVKAATIDGADANTSSTSFVASTLTLSITPSSTSSKILILISTHMYCDDGKSGVATIYRGSTNLANHAPEYGLVRVYNQYGVWQSVNMSYLDSPSTTNSTTYTAYWKNLQGSGSVYMNQDNNQSHITLMEIAG